MSTDTVTRRAREQVEGYSPDEERPLAGYTGAMAVYASAVAAAAGIARLTGRRLPERLPAGDIALMALATHKVSRLVSKDAVTSPLRAPFTRFDGASGDAELHEEVRSHGGVKHAVGELITCPFCLAQWVATAFGFGYVFAPRPTRFAAAVMTAVAGSDFLQQAYAFSQRTARG